MGYAFVEGKTAAVSVRKGTLLLIHEKMRGIMQRVFLKKRRVFARLFLT